MIRFEPLFLPLIKLNLSLKYKKVIIKKLFFRCFYTRCGFVKNKNEPNKVLITFISI